MHFIVTAIGSAGDINPMILIGKELARRGHRLDFIASGYFQNRIEEANLSFVPLGTADMYLSSVRDPHLWQPSRGFSAVWKALRLAMIEEYRLVADRIVPGRTKLVGSTLAFGSRMASEKLRAKMATVHLAPTCLLSACDMPVLPGMPDLAWLPLSARRLLLEAADILMLDAVCLKDINQARCTLGLPPVRRVISKWLHSPDRVICAFPHWFAPAQPDWPANSLTTGFPLDTSGPDASLPFELTSFLDHAGPPLVFTAGTAMRNSRPFFQTALKAAEALKIGAIFLSQFPEQLPDKLPPNVRAMAYAPFDLLLPRARALVHHGGIGTCAQGLAAGIPQLIAPFAHDQFDNAARLKRLGVGEVVLVHNDARLWSHRLNQLLASRDVASACAMFKAKMQVADPLPAIADLIERLS